MTDTTRRDFIINSSLTMGVTLGAMAFGGSLLSPGSAQAAKPTFKESSCGDGRSTVPKILIAYASICGTTGDVAEAIGRQLCDLGARVDVRLVDNATVDPSAYQAVVIGSAVRSSSWLPEAKDFVVTHKARLSKLPVAYFLTCLALSVGHPDSRKTAMSYFKPVLEEAPEVKPVDLAGFAGVYDLSKMNMMYRLVMRSKMKKQGVAEGDYRDWRAIKAWADSLAGRFKITV